MLFFSWGCYNNVSIFNVLFGLFFVNMFLFLEDKISSKRSNLEI